MSMYTAPSDLDYSPDEYQPQCGDLDENGNYIHIGEDFDCCQCGEHWCSACDSSDVILCETCEMPLCGDDCVVSHEEECASEAAYDRRLDAAMDQLVEMRSGI